MKQKEKKILRDAIQKVSEFIYYELPGGFERDWLKIADSIHKKIDEGVE